MTKSINLASLASAVVTTLLLKHPATGEEVGISISGHTPDSAEWEKNKKAIFGAGKETKMLVEKNGMSTTFQDTSEEQKKLILASITSIDNAEMDGKPFVSTPENIKELLSQPEYSWMLEQWSNHIDDRANFFK